MSLKYCATENLFWIWQLAKFSTQRLCDYLGFGFSTIRWNAIWTSASPYSGYKRNEFYDSRCPHAEAGCCWKGTNHSFYIEGEFLIFVKWNVRAGIKGKKWCSRTNRAHVDFWWQRRQRRMAYLTSVCKPRRLGLGDTSLFQGERI